MDSTKIKIGRSAESNVVIEERWDTISNNHADIVLRSGQLYFIDHSSNGTIINQQMIHNMEVGIYPGDKIMLAGVYDLSWDLINTYFPNMKRPTVTNNIREGLLDDATRKTVHLDKGQSQNNRKHRVTEQFKESSQHQHCRGQHGKQTLESNSIKAGLNNTFSQAEMDSYLEKWNWGGFFATWKWSVFNRIYNPLIIIPIVFIPYLGQVAQLVLSVYLGIHGSKLAWSKNTDNDFAAFMRHQKRWSIIGVFIFFAGIALNAIILYYILQLI